mgnify:CR=1 FL=1
MPAKKEIIIIVIITTMRVIIEIIIIIIIIIAAIAGWHFFSDGVEEQMTVDDLGGKTNMTEFIPLLPDQQPEVAGDVVVLETNKEKTKAPIICNTIIVRNRLTVTVLLPH